MVLRQAVTVTDVGVIDAMQRHVHGADTEHGGVKIKAVEHGIMEMLTGLFITEKRGVGLAQIFTCRHQEPTSARCRITDNIVGRWLSQFDHQLNDMAWGAELAVGACTGNLAQHILVKVALGVAVFHRDFVEHFDGLCEQRSVREPNSRVLHVGAVA